MYFVDLFTKLCSQLLRCFTLFQCDSSFFQEFLFLRANLQNKLQEWNKEVPRIQAEFKLLEYCDCLGIDLDEDDPASQIKKIKSAIVNIASERKENMKTRKDITVITGSDQNRIIDNFETGEITIEAITEDDIEKGFQQLISRGIIAD